jgi:hypothetical protein
MTAAKDLVQLFSKVGAEASAKQPTTETAGAKA